MSQVPTCGARKVPCSDLEQSCSSLPTKTLSHACVCLHYMSLVAATPMRKVVFVYNGYVRYTIRKFDPLEERHAIFQGRIRVVFTSWVQGRYNIGAVQDRTVLGSMPKTKLAALRGPYLTSQAFKVLAYMVVSKRTCFLSLKQTCPNRWPRSCLNTINTRSRDVEDLQFARQHLSRPEINEPGAGKSWDIILGPTSIDSSIVMHRHRNNFPQI